MTSKPKSGKGVDRRTALKLAAGAGLATACGLGFARPAKAADVTLNVWTGYPELVPYYKAVAEEYAKTHAGFKINLLSTSLREHEQKLSAAMPTGTGPDIFDVGANISIKFAGANLLKPNNAEIDQYMKANWSKYTIDFLSFKGKTYGLPLLEGRAAMYWNKAMFKEAGVNGPPTTYGELMEAAKKIVKVDASGKMTRSGISMRLSGQGSGITEKFRFVLEPAGGKFIEQTKSGKWHNGYDNDAGRAALQFYVDVVQKDKVDDPKVPHDADAFANGTTAMLFREAWVIGEIQKKSPTLDFGVAPIPRWDAKSPYKMLVQPWAVYVSGRSKNEAASWDFLKFLSQPNNARLITEMTGWGCNRQGVDWAPLLAKTPQFGVFVQPPKDVTTFSDPVIEVFDELESRAADKLPGLYVDSSLNGNPAKVAEAIKALAAQTDDILKKAGMYGTS